MSKQKISALEYIRGISMLGVVGIHTGAYSLSNPHVNIHLFALLEIFTRFSVPIFFFVSAFGLFLGQNLSEPFHYGQFLLRRCRSVLIPYVIWSLLYMLHYTRVSGDTQIWSSPLIFEYFFYGLASYQLYFLVILIWFYILMPIWRAMVKKMATQPITSLAVLLILQIAFNYYSSYLLHVTTTNYYLQKALSYRISYWVFHYIFIFVAGALCAVKYASFKHWITYNQKPVQRFFYITLTGMLGFYYYLIYGLGYTPEQAVNTDHQLSPIGVLYTLSASLFWFTLFSNKKFPSLFEEILSYFGKHSYFVYLIHPFIMYYVANYWNSHGLLMTVRYTILFYLVTVILSLVLSTLTNRISRVFPIINLLLQGQSTPNKRY